MVVVFAGAVRTDEAIDRAGGHREREVVDRRVRAERLRDARQFHRQSGMALFLGERATSKGSRVSGWKSCVAQSRFAIESRDFAGFVG